MIIDLTRYRVQKQEIVRAHNRSNGKSLLEMICLASPGTHTPNVVLCFYLAEDIGFTKEIVEIIERLIKFYGYTSIKGAPDNMPEFGLKRI